MLTLGDTPVDAIIDIAHPTVDEKIEIMMHRHESGEAVPETDDDIHFNSARQLLSHQAERDWLRFRDSWCTYETVRYFETRSNRMPADLEALRESLIGAVAWHLA